MTQNRLCQITAALVLALCAACSSAHRAADPTYSFGTTPGRLPKDVVPVRYTIDLAPDLNAKTFVGEEAVEIEVRQPTQRVVLNAADVTITAAELLDEPQNRADIAP